MLYHPGCTPEKLQPCLNYYLNTGVYPPAIYLAGSHSAIQKLVRSGAAYSVVNEIQQAHMEGHRRHLLPLRNQVFGRSEI